MDGVEPHSDSCVSQCLACGLSTVFLALIGWLGSHPEVPQPLWTIEKYYDFIVVGGGTTGCVVASRLSEIAHWKVLLIEAGSEQPLWMQVPGFSKIGRGSAFDWSFRTRPDDFACVEGCVWPRGRALGGSGIFDTMQVLRGHQGDFEAWREIAGDEWDFEHMLHYFKKTENNLDQEVRDWRYHATGGPQPVCRLPNSDVNVHIMKEAFKEIGFMETDLNGFEGKGVMVTQAFSYAGRRVTSYDAYLSRTRMERTNLLILTHCLVTKVIIDPIKKYAKGVQLIDPQGRLISVFSKLEVILCAGVINTPQILMLSGIGPIDVLGSLNIPQIKDLPVGHNLHDHVGLGGLELEFSKTAPLPNESVRIAHLTEYLQMQRGPLASTGPQQLVAMWRSHFSPPGESAPDVLFTLEPLRRKDDVDVYYSRVQVHALLTRSRSRGRVLLNSSDPRAPAVVHANYLSSPEDRAVLLEAAQLVAGPLTTTRVLEAAGIRLRRERSLPGCERFQWGSNEYWSCAARQHTDPGHAAAGTCRMGRSSDADAVVDPRLRVLGLVGLRVADASVLPLPISGRLRAVCIALGERAADFIKDELLGGYNQCHQPLLKHTVRYTNK